MSIDLGDPSYMHTADAIEGIGCAGCSPGGFWMGCQDSPVWGSQVPCWLQVQGTQLV